VVVCLTTTGFRIINWTIIKQNSEEDNYRFLSMNTTSWCGVFFILEDKEKFFAIFSDYNIAL